MKSEFERIANVEVTDSQYQTIEMKLSPYEKE